MARYKLNPESPRANLLFAVVFSLFSVLPVHAYAKQLAAEIRSRRYVPAKAEVVTSTVTCVGEGRRSGWVARIDYQFTYRGQIYRGSDTNAAETAWKTTERAEAARDRHPPGSSLVVYHDPTTPTLNGMSRGFSGWAGMGLLVAVPFPAMAIYLWGRWWVTHRSQRSARTLRLSRDAELVGVLKSAFHGAVVAAAMFCLPIVSFFAGAVVLDGMIQASAATHFWFGVLTIAVICVICLVVFLAINQHRPWRSMRITIDERTRVLRLTRGTADDALQTIRFQDIARIIVRQIGSPGDRRWKSVRYVPTLILKRHNGTQREIGLVEWRSQARADSLVSQLRELMTPVRPTETDATRWAAVSKG